MIEHTGLAARGLACTRGERVLFSGLAFDVPAGGALAITGPNGVGKSSLLRILAGLLAPSAGQIALSGGEADVTLGERSHSLGHRDALKPSLSAAENLRFWIQFLTDTGNVRSDMVVPALAAVGLDTVADLPAGYLSAGQRRRLSLARLLAVPRPLWLLDEPLTALDTAFQTQLADLMRRHLAGGGLIVAATHAPLGIDAPDLRLDGAAGVLPS